MPTTAHKEPRNGLSLERRTKRLAALLNPAQPFLVALRQRNLRRLFAGLVVSQAGDWLYNLALLAFVYERTGSTVWVGITTAARILPEVVLGPIGGVLADRHDRRVVMILSDVLRAASMGALALVLGAIATTRGLSFAVDLGAAAIILMNLVTLVLAMTTPFTMPHFTAPPSST